MSLLKLAPTLAVLVSNLDVAFGEWAREDIDAPGDGEDTEECTLLATKQRRTVAATESEEEFKQWEKKGVFRSWLEHHAQHTLSSSYQECRLNATESCKLESMTGPTLVYPGGKTTCINGDEYAFAVNPGDKDKLVFYFEGGGACWQVKGNVVLQCTATLSHAIATTGLGVGIQNRSDEENPFRSYTIVEPLYCSGDAFIGNAIQDWNGQEMTQMGYWNAQAALDWVKSNANYCGHFKSVVVGGFSAGGLGTMAWVDTILRELPAASQAMLVDSYAGVFPPDTEGPIAKGWGGCTIPILSAEQREACQNLEYSVQAHTKTAMAAHKHARFAFIQSKVDASQIWFYHGLAASNFDAVNAQITDAQFYNLSLGLFTGYVPYSNFKLFLVSGSTHTFTDGQDFVTTTSAGPDTTTGFPLPKWTGSLVKFWPTKSICTGNFTTSPEPTDVDYCDPAVTPECETV